MEKNKLSAKTLALFAAAVILLASGGVMTTRSALNIVSPNGNATLETSSVSVQLLMASRSVHSLTLRMHQAVYLPLFPAASSYRARNMMLREFRSGTMGQQMSTSES